VTGEFGASPGRPPDVPEGTAVPGGVGERAVADGDGSFEGFARLEHRGLVAFGWALTGDLGVAEDLAQEALAAAWSRWDEVGGYERPSAWVRRVVANRAASGWRRSGREQRALRRWTGRQAVPTVELEPADDRFWAALRRLPPRQAQALALHYLEDWGVAEVATALGCAEATVRVHLHRGRAALARLLGDEREEGR
jgi:RNA polymerase sigma-70 factor (ECF subfamily)